MNTTQAGWYGRQALDVMCHIVVESGVNLKCPIPRSRWLSPNDGIVVYYCCIVVNVFFTKNDENDESDELPHLWKKSPMTIHQRKRTKMTRKIWEESHVSVK